MHKEILTKEQIELLPLVARFSRNFGLVGGTAIALHIGHRESLDFDLFSGKEFKNLSLAKKFSDAGVRTESIVNKKGEYTLLVNGVKMTFFHYPFSILYEEQFEDIVRMPSLLTLAAMKAYALGMRAKWKDYIDLYFIFRDHHDMREVVVKTHDLFGEQFNEKMFKVQLSYFQDINYSEEVVFRPGFEVEQEKVKRSLVEWATA